MDAAKLDGKRVCVVDDVVSTGGSLHSLEAVLAKTGCTVASKVAVLLEEGGYDGQRFDLSRKAAGLQGLADFPKARRAARRARPFSYRAPFGVELR